MKHKPLFLDILNKHKKLPTARDSFNCNYRYAKYLIVELSLHKSNYMMAWEAKQCLVYPS